MTAPRKARRRVTRAKGQSAAVMADVWEDRPDKARPTKERRAKGAFRLVDGEDAGVTIAIDDCATVLDWLERCEVINADQRQAGLDLAALLDRTRLGSAGRSCLDFSPVGYEGDIPTTGEERDAQDRAEIYLACGVATWAELRRVCQEQRIPGNVARLRHGPRGRRGNGPDRQRRQRDPVLTGPERRNQVPRAEAQHPDLWAAR